MRHFFRKHRGASKRLSCLVFLLLMFFRLALAQTSPPREYQVKAVFLYQFTQFVDWSPSAFPTAASPFIIGILGNDPFGVYLDETVAGEKMMGHPITVKRFSDIKTATDCHILFISAAEAAKGIVDETDHKNVLTVSDASRFAEEGGMICFLRDKEKIRLQINVSAAKEANLNISSKLLRLAQIVE